MVFSLFPIIAPISADVSPLRTRRATSSSLRVNRALARARLTRKEEEVARLVLKGLTSAEIGEMMGNSEKTIKQHLTQVYAKLGVAGRAEFFHLVFPS